MSRFLALSLAVLSFAAPYAARADDGPPTLGERMGYALSLARQAAQGDKKSLTTLQTNAAMQDAGAEFGLGEYHSFIKDYPQAVVWFQKSADQDFPGGWYGLGRAYDLGQGEPVDYAQAMRLYLKATALSEADIRIGDLYAHGRGVPADDAQALSWYRKAADAGSLEAYLILGYRYETGAGAQQDDRLALHWYNKAAQLGEAKAEYLLGHMYQRLGTPQDYRQAALWYGKASQQGVADAQLALGLLYSSGKGVPADAGKAVQQFQMAANQGQPHAQARLAESFAGGTGVPADAVRAYMWFTVAERSLKPRDPDHALAEKRLKELEQQMSPAEIARAKEAAAAWHPNQPAEQPEQL